MPSRETLNSDHDRHDRALIARYAAGDAYPTEVAQARNLVDSCAECSALASDISLISARVSELPQLKRSRDFRISPEQAEQLTGSWFGRLMRNISAPGWTVVRPLAGAALAIGILVAAVGAVPINGFLGGTAGALAPAALGPSNFGLIHTSEAKATQEPARADAIPSAAEGPGSEDTASSGAPAPQAGQGSASAVPGGVSVDMNSATPETTTTGPLEASPTNPPPPPKAAQSPGPTPTHRAVAAVQSPPPPTVVPQAPANGNAAIASTKETSVDRSALVVGGLLLAVVALLVLLLVWFARQRYTDPLVR